MLFSKLLLFVGVVCLALVIPTLLVSAGENARGNITQNTLTEKEFRAQYAVALAKYKEGYQNLECRYDCQYKSYKFQAKFLTKSDSVIALMDYAEETPFQGKFSNEIVCVTPNYAFTLSKIKPDAPYLLSSVRTSSQQVERVRAIIGRDVDIYLFAANHVFEASVEKLLELPSFTFEKIERYSSPEDKAEELVALEFRLNDNTWILKKGRIVFSPSLNWAVREYNITDEYNTNYSGKNTYTPLQKNGIPILKQGEHEENHYINGKKSNTTIKYSAKLIDFSFGTVDDSVFLLSAYDLPDAALTPPGLTARNTTQWFLIGNGVLLLLIISWYCINCIKRSRATQKPERQSGDAG